MKQKTKSLEEVLVREDIIKESLPMYDITVQDNHNYFIKASEDLSLLSHNCLEFVVHEIIGPVVVVSRTTSLKPELRIVKTGITWKVSKLWTYSISNMLKCKAKNELIVNHVIEDLKTHPCIIIPTDRTEHLQVLRNMVNDRAIKEGLISRSDFIAYPFFGGMSSKDKKDVLEKVDNGKCRVLVSMRSMIKQGIDLKIPTMLYSIIPETATKEAGSPMFLQLSNRPCTPHLNKKQPIVKIFVDETDLSYACFKSLFSKEIKPNLTPNANNNFTARYILPDEFKKIAYELMTKKADQIQQKPGFFSRNYYNKS